MKKYWLFLFFFFSFFSFERGGWEIILALLVCFTNIFISKKILFNVYLLYTDNLSVMSYLKHPFFRPLRLGPARPVQYMYILYLYILYDTF